MFCFSLSFKGEKSSSNLTEIEGERLKEDKCEVGASICDEMNCEISDSQLYSIGEQQANLRLEIAWVATAHRKTCKFKKKSGNFEKKICF